MTSFHLYTKAFLVPALKQYLAVCTMHSPDGCLSESPWPLHLVSHTYSDFVFMLSFPFPPSATKILQILLALSLLAFLIFFHFNFFFFEISVSIGKEQFSESWKSSACIFNNSFSSLCVVQNYEPFCVTMYWGSDTTLFMLARTPSLSYIPILLIFQLQTGFHSISVLQFQSVLSQPLETGGHTLLRFVYETFFFHLISLTNS